MLRACRRLFIWRRRRRRALGFASLAGGWQPPAPLLPPTGSQTARPFPPYHTSRLADRSASYPPCPYGMPLATFVPSAQPRVREAASLRSAASYWMPLATLDLICSAFATQIELSICPLPLLRHQEWQPFLIGHRRNPQRQNM